MYTRPQGLHILSVVTDGSVEDQLCGVITVALAVGLVQGEQQPVGQLVTQKGIDAVHGLADHLRGDGDHNQTAATALAVGEVAGLREFGCCADHELRSECPGPRNLNQAAAEEGLDLREIHAMA